MEFFQSLRNIDRLFRDMRLYGALFAALCLGVAVTAIALSYRFAAQAREKIYVLDQGKSLMLALSQDREANRPVEAREHVKRFHELVFTLSPDPEAIRGSMDRALALCDESGYQYYQDQLEKGYYKRLISGNVLTRAVADSVVGDFSVYPYRMAYYGHQLIMRASQVTVRSLVTTCRLANAVRSDANPHGFQLQDFTVVENRDLQVDRKE